MNEQITIDTTTNNNNNSNNKNSNDKDKSEYKYSTSTFVLDKFLKSQFKIADYVLHRSTLVNHNDSRVNYPEDVNRIQKFELNFRNQNEKNEQWSQENESILIYPSEQSKSIIEDKDNVIFWLIFDKALSARSIYNYNLMDLKSFIVWWTAFKIEEIEYLRDNIIRYYQCKEDKEKVEEEMRQLKLSLKNTVDNSENDDLSNLNDKDNKNKKNESRSTTEFFESFKQTNNNKGETNKTGKQVEYSFGSTEYKRMASNKRKSVGRSFNLQTELFDYVCSFYRDEGKNKPVPKRLLKSEYDWWFSVQRLVLDRIKMKICIYGVMQRRDDPTVIKSLDLDFDWMDFGLIIDKYRSWFYKLLSEAQDLEKIKSKIEQQRSERKKWIKQMSKMLDSKYKKIVDRNKLREQHQLQQQQQQYEKQNIRTNESSFNEAYNQALLRGEQEKQSRINKSRKRKLKEDGNGMKRNKRKKTSDQSIQSSIGIGEQEEENYAKQASSIYNSVQSETDYIHYYYSQYSQPHFIEHHYHYHHHHQESLESNNTIQTAINVDQESELQSAFDMLREEEEEQESTLIGSSLLNPIYHQEYLTPSDLETNREDSFLLPFERVQEYEQQQEQHYHQDGQSLSFSGHFSENLFKSDSFVNF